MREDNLPVERQNDQEFLIAELNEQVDTFGYDLFMKCCIMTLEANRYKSIAFKRVDKELLNG